MDGFDPVIQAAIVAIAAYLLGSIPFGLVLTKLAGLGDVRSIGSGNIGATNVLRTGNKGLALATVLLDGGKGALAVVLAGMFAPAFILMAAGASFLGHLFPIWLGFKGGKGVATFLGIALAINWVLGLICCATWLLTALVFRMSSLASIAAAIAGPIYGFIQFGAETGLVFTALAALVLVRHRENIARIIKGEEPKIGQK